MGSSIETAKRLAELAASQDGYFTATQAVEAGYVDSVHGYHLANGDWEKVQRGVYRLLSHAQSARPELALWRLWSRNKEGEPEGVYSHITALELHGFMEHRPGPLHMTVPRDFRRNTELPAELVLHKADLTLVDIEQRPGCALTTLARTVADLEADPQGVFALDTIRHNLPPGLRWTKSSAPSARNYNDVIDSGED
jgi:predicted transcriptional regulator of viral defense system